MSIKVTIKIMIAIISVIAFTANPQKLQKGEGNFIELKDAKIYYQSYGSGTPVIVVHGGPGLDHTYLLPQLADLSDEHKLIFYDQRGSGKSEAVVDSTTITLDNFVEDLEALRRELKIEKVNLLGHSWGGFLAMNYALKYPDNIDKIILISTIPASSDYVPEFLEQRENRRTEEDKILLNEIMSSENFLNGDAEFMENFTRLFFKSYFHNQELVNELTLNFSERTAGNFIPIYTLMSKYFTDYDLSQQLSELQNKIFLIHGDDDVIPLLYIEELNSILPNAELVILKDCGHFPFVENKTDLIKNCNNFLKEP